MPNTNFQTIHQMGSAINDFVKQATGQDNVQNIDMEHITVAQNHYYEEVDISGAIVSFRAGAAGIPLEKCLVQINPVQDLHGYDHPWPAGGGKNKLPPGNAGTESNNGVTYSSDGNGSYTFDGTATADSTTKYTLLTPYTIVSGDYLHMMNPIANAYAGMILDFDDGTSAYPTFSNANRIFDLASRVGKQITAIGFTVSNGNAYSGTITPMVVNSAIQTTFSPYSNICPISGWTEAKIFVSPTTDESDGNTYTIAFPAEAGTVYGGTLDVVTGELVVNRAIIASYNGETLPGEWISDRDVYASGATPTTGAQVVYELATPVTYTLTASEIRTLLGPNNIWADTGDIEVKFKNIKEFF